ncbi:carboxylate-amine ligase [Methylovirgula sp. 4M-Z18]|uniref:carboxylate-amine ligase n=1 Tax=Methylovirgula sp. 4M-Z18 TaxID=2293567 RepID=UPI000E2F63EE|nr:carboxylate-amine ligase [Methylovirgula sp. 4M-Z18]RFB78842.1 carboxylate-amine ligase [Methylovirgula sp. 4M-Z18]
MSNSGLPPILTSVETSSLYSFGIEEEYFVTRLDTRDTCQQLPRSFVESCRKELGEVFEREMLQAQVEIATPPSIDMAEARQALASYRGTLGRIAADHDLGVLAAGTHPLAAWSRQRATEARRYGQIMHDLQMLGSRNMVCGMHVHVSLPDPDRRVNIMTRLTPFLPLLLALSTSSPFWQGRRTGLMGYRLASYDELPRTGLPELFLSAKDYQHYIDVMTAAHAINDATYVWWAVRPSAKYPTLELRIADSCTRVDDAIAIAALYRALIRKLDREPQINADLTAASRAIALENKWRAQRYGIHGSFVDEKQRKAVTIKQALDDLLELVGEDAEALGCLNEAQSARDILHRGTSACQQLAIYSEARGRGKEARTALEPVVDWLMATTMGRPLTPTVPALAEAFL